MNRAPNAKLERVVDATVEPITRDQAKLFLKSENTADDTMIDMFIKVARRRCEALVDRSFVATQWRLTLDYFPPVAGPATNILPAIAFGVAATGSRSFWVNMEGGCIRLPCPPLISVDSITYRDVGGNWQTLAPSAYVVGLGTPGQVAPAFGTFFPLTMPVIGSVKVLFTCGYSSDASLVPPDVPLAMQFLVSHFWNHRSTDVPVPSIVNELLDDVRW